MRIIIAVIDVTSQIYSIYYAILVIKFVGNDHDTCLDLANNNEKVVISCLARQLFVPTSVL